MSTIHQANAGAGVADAAEFPTGRVPRLNATWVSLQEGSRDEITILPPASFGSPLQAVWMSPTIPKSTSSKIGASGSLLTATIVFDVNP